MGKMAATAMATNEQEKGSERKKAFKVNNKGYTGAVPYHVA